jgi:hypothetical protein
MGQKQIVNPSKLGRSSASGSPPCRGPSELPIPYVVRTVLVSRPVRARVRARHGVLLEAPSETDRVTKMSHATLRASDRRPRRKDRRRCHARTRAGGTCLVRAEPGKARCRFHGGLSAGPRTEEGRARIAEAQRRRWRAYIGRKLAKMLGLVIIDMQTCLFRYPELGGLNRSHDGRTLTARMLSEGGGGNGQKCEINPMQKCSMLSRKSLAGAH